MCYNFLGLGGRPSKGRRRLGGRCRGRFIYIYICIYAYRLSRGCRGTYIYIYMKGFHTVDYEGFDHAISAGHMTNFVSVVKVMSGGASQIRNGVSKYLCWSRPVCIIMFEGLGVDRLGEDDVRECNVEREVEGVPVLDRLPHQTWNPSKFCVQMFQGMEITAQML